MALFISILTFLVATLIFVLVWLFFGTDPKQEVIRRRMEAVHKAERRGGEVSLGLELVRDEMFSTVPLLHRLMMRWSWSRQLQDLLLQAGMETKPGKLLLLSGVIGMGTYVLVGRFYLQFPVAIVLGAAAGSLPLAFVAWMRQRRLRQFEEHFPEALDLLGRAVRAGHAFTTGLEMIAKESAEPIAGEFRTTFEEQNFGLPLRDALLNMAERIPLIDVRFFVTALLIQKETGGNLAEILDGLARVIRDRFRIYREVQTRTAQGRLTALILIGLPPFMMLVLAFVNPRYIGLLFTDPAGPTLLTIAAMMQLVGSAIIWKIIHIEV
ncbi:MAG: type II secretion system F family protein [Candidatus Acidiferrales bacterium]